MIGQLKSYSEYFKWLSYFVTVLSITFPLLQNYPISVKYSAFDAEFCVGLMLYVIVVRLVSIQNGL